MPIVYKSSFDYNPSTPFLRWAGGKSLFVNKIADHLPDPDEIGNYYEPFLGAGSVFLHYQPHKACLSDLNGQLINAFEAIRSHSRQVSRELDLLIEQNKEEFYYSIRESYNRGRTGAKQAAKFIYLNRTCFNGIFRVNQKGKFNVPYGHKKNVIVPSKEKLASIAKLLDRVSLTACGFESSVSTAKKNDLVYLDPPYPPINGSSYFTHYTKERFSDEDQHEVANTAISLSDRGCFVLVTNADTPAIRKYYKDWNITSIERPRYITSSKHKHKVSELIITNYS